MNGITFKRKAKMGKTFMYEVGKGDIISEFSVKTDFLFQSTDRQVSTAFLHFYNKGVQVSMESDEGHFRQRDQI